MGGFSLDLVGDDVRIVVGEPHVVVHLSQGSPVPETGMRVSNMNTTTHSTTTTATATTTGRIAYLNHWIRKNAAAPNAAKIASLALQGKRDCSRHWSGEPLRYPDEFIFEISKMTPAQLQVSEDIACAFGHLWACIGTPIDWADYFNNDQDTYCNCQHPLPTPADKSASGRYKWEVDRLGTVNFEVNRPSGTACRVNGTLDNFVITITKLALDRHLVCLHQQLQNIFGLSTEDSIERIYSAKGFSSMGIRGGELERILLVAE